MRFSEQLRRIRACEQATEWVGTRSLNQAWEECSRPDWMFWLIRELDVDVRWVAVDLAVRTFAPLALEAVGACNWADLLRELPEIVDAETAGQALFYAAASAASAAYAASAAADAASYASYAAAAAYAAAARNRVGLECADAIRGRINASVITSALNTRLLGGAK